jgi:SagB-type dehydrogenase family enzyme
MGLSRIQGNDNLKSNWQLVDEGFASDQSKGLAAPPQEKPVAPGAEIQRLPPPEAFPRRGGPIFDLLAGRKSRRKYAEGELSLEELAALAWAAAGIKLHKEKFSLRTAPSAGARHPLELYVYVSAVTGLSPGLYRYLPIEHGLCLVRGGELSAELDAALLDQFWQAAAVFVWTALPYRCEWRYGPVAPKLILLDAGHSCENLYLACEGLGLGTCAIGAYDQEAMDAFLGVDGAEELAVYAAPVGRV